MMEINYIGKDPKVVCLVGGTGFVGRFLTQSLARRGYLIIIASRNPAKALPLQVYGYPGQIAAIGIDINHPETIPKAISNADIVVNLAGQLTRLGGQSFEQLHVRGSYNLACAISRLGHPRFIHLSAIGAHEHAFSRYGRSKAKGEEAVLSEVPRATILRPSVIFGAGDESFTRFAALARFLPFIPIIGAKTLLQPVYVFDVAEAISNAIDGGQPGTIYELGGPEKITFKDLVQYICTITWRHPRLVTLPFGLAKVFAAWSEFVTFISLGLDPQFLRLTRDQVELLKTDNIVSDKSENEHFNLAGLGVSPTSFRDIDPQYLWRYRKRGIFDSQPA